MLTKFFKEDMKGRDQKLNLGIDGRIVMKWILKKEDRRMWAGFIWLMTGTHGVNMVSNLWLL